ncbi:PulJ/GspJ family protein [Deinococcus gobiensis]|uniref:PulJ/GspJ family protein n=1 Tax=Deinococcus gobiensis TaxID=502394 RepID=UPI0011AE3BA4|nr:type II secretion system protein [Deinococcus gobiensis]
MEHRPAQHDLANQGFTIIELLVAIALLGILTTVLTATLTGSLNLNRQAQRQLDTTSTVQQIMENVRNAWSTASNYNSACAPNLSQPAGYTVNFVNLNTRAQPLTATGAVATGTGISAAPSNSINRASTCTAATGAMIGSGATAQIPAMRRVIVQSGASGPNGSQVVGPQDITLTYDILGPQ